MTSPFNHSKASRAVRQKPRRAGKESRARSPSRTGRVSVLLVDDDATDFHLVKKLLTVDPRIDRIEHASNLVDAKSLCDRLPIDVVLLDLTLAEISGTACVREASRLMPEIPIVALTSLDNEQTARKVLECGVQDYLIKPPSDAKEVVNRLVYAVQRHQLKQSDETLIARLSEAATTDPLTDLLNQGSIQAEAGRQFRIAKRSGAPLSIGMVDLDYFKAVNDNFGHSVGNEVLVSFANLIRSMVRASDYVGRVGGEEFCVILPNTDREQGAIWGLRTCEKIRNSPIETSAGPIEITVSIGLAAMDQNVVDARSLIDFADGALQCAKRNGRDRISSDLAIRCSSSAIHPPSSLADARVFEQFTARDIMLPIAAKLKSTQSVAEVAKFMVDFRFDSLIVLDENDSLTGLITEEDIVAHLLRGGSWNAPIANATSRGVGFSADATLGKVWEFFQRVPVRRLVVHDRDSQPVGMIHRGQVLRWCVNFSAAGKHDPNSAMNSSARQELLANLRKNLRQQSDDLIASLADPSAIDEVDLIGSVSGLQDLLLQALTANSTGATLQHSCKGFSSLV